MSRRVQTPFAKVAERHSRVFLNDRGLLLIVSVSRLAKDAVG